MKILNYIQRQINSYKAERQRQAWLDEKLEALTDPTLIDRMYCDHLITVSIQMIDNLTPKLREISNGLK